jgi:hypothetical protein
MSVLVRHVSKFQLSVFGLQLYFLHDHGPSDPPVGLRVNERLCLLVSPPAQ